MSEFVQAGTNAAPGSIPGAAGGKDGERGRGVELAVLALVLLLVNLPLFLGGSLAALTFDPGAVAVRQEWWRLVTHPFAHVSAYHFVLDGAAFLVLYANLAAARRWQRLAYVVAAAMGSLVVAACASPLIATHGLCGLSGIAHGLMAISAVEMLVQTRREDHAGWAMGIASLGCVVGKCMLEALTGHAFFAGMHMGSVGTPIVECHAGGVLGGLAAWWLCGWLDRAKNPGAGG